MTNPQPTQPEPTTAERIAAVGHPIILRDGREVRVRYGLRGLARLEKHYGGLKAIAEALELAVSGGGEGEVLGHVYAILAAGLIHEKIDEDDLDLLLDPRRLRTYSGAMAAAFAEAMPEGAPAGKVEVPGPAPTPPGPLGPQAQADVATLVEASRTASVSSTGEASTGSEPSPLAAPTPNGGT